MDEKFPIMLALSNYTYWLHRYKKYRDIWMKNGYDLKLLNMMKGKCNGYFRHPKKQIIKEKFTEDWNKFTDSEKIKEIELVTSFIFLKFYFWRQIKSIKCSLYFLSF